MITYNKKFQAGDKQKEGKPSGEEVKNKEDYKKMEDGMYAIKSRYMLFMQ